MDPSGESDWLVIGAAAICFFGKRHVHHYGGVTNAAEMLPNGSVW